MRVFVTGAESIPAKVLQESICIGLRAPEAEPIHRA
jgi:hypothetical protein